MDTLINMLAIIGGFMALLGFATVCYLLWLLYMLITRGDKDSD
jgi:phage shock protein PspC (stress-responsive transcriptional regulator)